MTQPKCTLTGVYEHPQIDGYADLRTTSSLGTAHALRETRGDTGHERPIDRDEARQ